MNHHKNQYYFYVFFSFCDIFVYKFSINLLQFNGPKISQSNGLEIISWEWNSKAKKECSSLLSIVTVKARKWPSKLFQWNSAQ